MVASTAALLALAVSGSAWALPPQLPEAGRKATAQLDPTFDEAYRTYSKMPLLGIGAGYRF